MTDIETYQALQQFYLAYSRCVDSKELESWPDFFTEACSYRVQPRENHDRGLPLATLSLESKGMLKDRVYGIKETLFHDPYYQRHIVEAPLVTAQDEDGMDVEANYIVVRTKPGKPSEVFNTGRYYDRVRRTKGGFLFERRLCVFDTELIPNSMIYPI